MAQSFQEKGLTINLSARIPKDRLKGWLEADQRFTETWFRQRRDLNDQSQSGYDLALACFGLAASLSEQDIVDLIVHHRAEHKRKPRTSADYFQRTLAKAANGSEYSSGLCPDGRVGQIEIVSAPDDFPGNEDAPEGNPENSDRKRIRLCQQISSRLGITVLRLVKLSGRQPIYRMDLPEGKIEFEDVRKFINQETVRAAIAARAGKLINRVNRRLWDQLAQAMLDACVVEEGGEELELEGQARIFIDRYLADVTSIPSIENQIPQDRRRPLVRDGRVLICAGDMQLHIFKTTAQNLSVRLEASMLSCFWQDLLAPFRNFNLAPSAYQGFSSFYLV